MITKNNTHLRNNKNQTFRIFNLEPAGSHEPACMLNKIMKGGTTLNDK